MKRSNSKWIGVIRGSLFCFIMILLLALACVARTEASTVSSFQAKAVPVKNAIVKSPSVCLSWKADATANAYEIERSESQTGNYSQIAFLVGEDTTTYTDTNVKKGHTYYYRIRTYHIAAWTDVYGNYTTPVKVTLSSKLAKPKLTYKRTKNKLAITFKTAEGTEYETQYRFAGQKKWKNLSSIRGKLTKTIRAKVNSQMKFTIRIRTKMTINGKVVYSKWAKKYTVK